MRKVIVYVATSADGFIARPDGDVQWLDRPRIAGNYGMGDFYQSIDTVVMGRKTHDVARKLGQPAYPGKKNYILSHKPPARASGNVEFVSRKIGKFAADLRRAQGKDVWLVGGAETIATFLDEGQIDEFIIHVVPVCIGEGIPLIAPRPRLQRLRLVGCKAYQDGVVRLHYVVVAKQESQKSRRTISRKKSPLKKSWHGIC